MRNELRIARGRSLPIDAVTQTFGILGKRGAGKTNTAVVIAEEMIRAGLPNIIVDPVGVWWGLRSSKDGQQKGLPVYIFGGEHGDIPLEEAAGHVVADFIVETRQPVVLDVSGFSKNAARRFMTDFGERLYRSNRDALHLTIDEADTFIPQRVARGEERLIGAINDIVRRGRARGLGVTLISQRPALINKDVLTQIEALITHRLTGPQDRDAIKRWVEHHADDDQAEKVLASLATLEDGEAWIWSPGWLGLFERIRIRERSTFDSSATPKVGEKRRLPKVVAHADLALLQERMAATVERAKSDDPRILQRRIAELEAGVRAVSAAPVRVEVPVVSDEQLARLGELTAALGTLVADLGEALRRVSRGASRPQPPAATALPPPPPAPPRARARREVAAKPNDEGDAPLRAGERRMLETLVQRHPLKLTRAQLGTLADFTASGGTFGAYFGTLKRRGFVVEDSVGVGATPDGIDEVGGAPSTPQTTEEILALWRSVLRAGERRMLDVLIEARPGEITREELGARSGFEASGGTFGAYLGTLRRNDLADVSGDLVRVSEQLFVEAPAARRKRG
jgi:hypothetical protein